MPVLLEDLRFEPLGEQNLPKEFDCDDSDLNEFILNDALTYQNENVARTTLVYHSNGTLLGFFSLCADTIRLQRRERKKHLIALPVKEDIVEYPALKIVRLGVCRDHQGKDIGTHIVRIVRGMALELQPKIGLRFLSVDAYPKSLEFYVKQGFLLNLEKEEKGRDNISLRYDLSPYVPK